MYRHRIWGLAALLLFAAAPRAAAQCEPGWLLGPDNERAGMLAAIESIAVIEEGAETSVYVGGPFYLVGGAAANQIARWDGRRWHALGDGLDGWGASAYDTRDLRCGGGGSSRPVSAITHYDGGVIAAGRFTQAGGAAVSNIARWDGVEWSPLGAGLNDRVRALAVHDGMLYAGGDFTQAGGAPAAHIARWDGQTWEQVGGGVNDEVHALLVHEDALIVGGAFTLAGDAIAQRIIRWDGGEWSEIGRADATVRALAEHEGTLVAGGDFTTIGDVPAPNVALWDGQTWMALGDSTLGGDTPILLVLASHGGDIYAAGDFTQIGEVLVRRIARWDGNAWHALDPGLRALQISALVTYDDALLMGGRLVGLETPPFEHYTRSNLLAWDGESTRLWGSGMSPYVVPIGWCDDHAGVLATATFRDELILAGRFATMNGMFVHNIVRWNGVRWAPLGEGIDRGLISDRDHSGVFAVIEYDDDLVVAGKFVAAGDVPVANIARWDGANWRPLGEGVGDTAPWSWIDDMVRFEGDVIVCGRFDEAGGVPVNGLARWDGAQWHALGADLVGDVNRMAVYGDQLIVSGSINYIGGLESPGSVVAWDGAQWHTLGTDDRVRGPVSAVAVYNGDLFVSGSLYIGDDPTSHRLASWNGEHWTGWGQILGYGWIAGMAVYRDDLYLLGAFSEVDGMPAENIARWDGARWHTLHPGLTGGPYPTGGEPWAKSLTEFRGELVFGGNFNAAGDQIAYNWARWGCEPIEGDVDRNRVVDLADLSSVLSALGSCEGEPHYNPAADFTATGCVELADVQAVLRNFGVRD